MLAVFQMAKKRSLLHFFPNEIRMRFPKTLYRCGGELLEIINSSSVAKIRTTVNER